MRGPIWQKAVKRFVLPELPGTWLVRTGELIMEPVGHVACAVGRLNARNGPTFSLFAHVQPLYVQIGGWQSMLALRLGRQGAGVSLPAFDTPEEGAHTMRSMVDLIRHEALPYFTSYGHLAGLLELCRVENRKFQAGGHYEILRQQAATEVMLGADSEAVVTLERLAKLMRALMSDGQPLPWMSDVLSDGETFRDRIIKDPANARAWLAQIEQEQRKELRLPDMPRDQQPS